MNVDNRKNEKKLLNETSNPLNDTEEMKENDLLTQQDCPHNTNKAEASHFYFCQ
jgi:hypothetical protein